LGLFAGDDFERGTSVVAAQNSHGCQNSPKDELHFPFEKAEIQNISFLKIIFKSLHFT